MTGCKVFPFCPLSIAMIIACLTVTARHRMSREEARIQAEARAYIRPAGDLPVLSWKGGNQYGQ